MEARNKGSRLAAANDFAGAPLLSFCRRFCVRTPAASPSPQSCGCDTDHEGHHNHQCQTHQLNLLFNIRSARFPSELAGSEPKR